MRRGLFIAAPGLALAVLACSAIFEDPVQCNADSDCSRFTNARCDRFTHVCVSRPAGSNDAGPPIDTDASVDVSTPVPDASDAMAIDAWEAEAAPVTTYLSDLTPATMANGFGPFEKDTSNGEDQPLDGVTITLNGTTYQKGLGVHAASELTYALGGNYSVFYADVGVDDEVMANGTVVFQVLVDDQLVFDSGTMTGDSVTKQVAVSVAGAQTLKLVVTDAADGISSDHADWAGARLVRF